MSLQRYFAFRSSTFPLVFCCIAAWFLDRLFVEFGHRSEDSPVCIHNDLQYVTYHQWVTVIAALCQTIIASSRRRACIKREAILLGSKHERCMCHINICQCILAILRTSILACALYISPWMSVSTVLKNRATIITCALSLIVVVQHTERCLYDRTLYTHYPGI